MVHLFLFKTAALVSSTLLASVRATDVGQGGVITLTHLSGSNLKVDTYGANIFSFCPSYDPLGDVLVVSRETVHDGIKPISGGITVVFPNLEASKDHPIPELGFARVSRWTVEYVKLANDENTYSSALLRLESSDATHQMWPFKFLLMYTVRLYSTSLETELTVMTTGSGGMDFQALLNNHFYVNDVRENGVVISGLQNAEYLDRVTGMTQNDTRESFGIMSRVDSIYNDVKNDVIATIKGNGFNKEVVIQKTARYNDGRISTFAAKTDCVVSNPWNEDTKSDFSNEEYIHMVAIGAGGVSQNLGVFLGVSYTVNQVITVSKST
uniref:glucose-6-phosphate 1-epimerase n=1 Tax=Hyaloperonospora arabidopsidis (strain Emoy2) TaxID=559515 RepID=M4BMV1_HYAAE